MADDNEMQYDIVIVGAGPAGLSAAIRLGQLNQQHDKSLKVCVLEKAAEVGGHILSGAVLDTHALTELLPNWDSMDAPISQPVTEEEFFFLTPDKHRRLPVPPPMRNENGFIVSLANVCRWLAKQAEALGIDIFPGFSAVDIIEDKQHRTIGIKTGDMGINKAGEKKSGHQPGMSLYAKKVIIAEGCRGSLSKKIIQHYHLADDADPQTYGIGIKEVWRVPQADPGRVIHTLGWPLDKNTYGGSWIYHLDEKTISIGFVLGLDYQNPFIDPFKELQRLKHHELIAPMLNGGKPIGYGARALNEGGIQSLPRLTFPGGVLVGCAAGMLNVARMKGSHNAMKSGMLAAESLFDAIVEDRIDQEVYAYQHHFDQSWVWQELYQARNVRPGFAKFGLYGGALNAALETYILNGASPWTLHHGADHQKLLPMKKAKKIQYPKPDGKLSFDKLTLLRLSNTNHEEDQPSHLKITDPKIPLEQNLKIYGGPEARYCPAGVYEYLKVEENGKEKWKFQINAANCLHCKTCDIKDPNQNIEWTPPEGGGGPNYTEM